MTPLSKKIPAMNPNANSSRVLEGQVILITRAERHQVSLRAAIEARSGAWASLPLIDIVRLSDAELQQALNRIQQLDRYDIIVFASQNAARIGAELIADYWPQLPVKQQFIAFGKGTAALLAKTLAAEADIPASGSDSEAVLRLPALNNVVGRRVLILRGIGGREHLAETLSHRGASVEYGELYRRIAEPHDSWIVTAELRGRGLSAVTVHSGESLTALSRLVRDHMDELVNMPLVVPSDRVASRAKEMGFLRVYNAGGVSDEMMVAALQKIYSSGN